MSKPDPAVVEESAPRGKGRKNNPEKTRQDILRAAIAALAEQTSDEALRTAKLSEKLTTTAQSQYSLVERFNR